MDQLYDEINKVRKEDFEVQTNALKQNILNKVGSKTDYNQNLNSKFNEFSTSYQTKLELKHNVKRQKKEPVTDEKNAARDFYKQKLDNKFIGKYRKNIELAEQTH